MSWVVMALFLATFFVSAAAASSAARARAKLDQALSGRWGQPGRPTKCTLLHEASGQCGGSGLVPSIEATCAASPTRACSAAKVDGVAIKMGKAKRFVQPLGSPPVSPSKSSVRSYGSSAYGAGRGSRHALA